jgi:hypothetical protein
VLHIFLRERRGRDTHESLQRDERQPFLARHANVRCGKRREGSAG